MKTVKILNYSGAVISFCFAAITAFFSKEIIVLTTKIMVETAAVTPEIITEYMTDSMLVWTMLLLLVSCVLCIFGTILLIFNIRVRGAGRALGITSSVLMILGTFVGFIPVFATVYAVVMMILFICAGFFRQQAPPNETIGGQTIGFK